MNLENATQAFVSLSQKIRLALITKASFAIIHITHISGMATNLRIKIGRYKPYTFLALSTILALITFLVVIKDLVICVKLLMR